MDEGSEAIAQDVLPEFFNCICQLCFCLFIVQNINPYRAKNKHDWEPSYESAIPG